MGYSLLFAGGCIDNSAYFLFAVKARGIGLKEFCKYFLILLVGYGFLGFGLAGASEVDSFTGRRPLQDSRDLLNAQVNEWLKKAVAATNHHSQHMAAAKYHRMRAVTGMPRLDGVDYCSKDHLYRIMRQYFARPLVGQLESYVNESPDLDTVKTKFEESIYQDFIFDEAPTIASTGKMAVLVRVNDIYMGSDKFGHFFTEGWSYFSSAIEAEEFDINAALEFGELSESVFFGSITTGVYSHADLAANFNGMRFWIKVLGDEPDPLNPNAINPDAKSGQKAPSYIACENKQWVIQQYFDWNEYVDIAWDEANNCSQFRNKVLFEKVSARVQSASKGNKNTACPLENNHYNELYEKYGHYLVHLFNGAGLKVMPENLQAANMLAKYLDLPVFEQLPKWQQRLIKRAMTEIESWQQAYLASGWKAS